MTAATAELELPSAKRTAQFIGQATAVEQARAVAEVQAAIVVAQNVPRDIARAEAEMQDACDRLALANRAFYTVPNRGHGPSVHLARELARIWGNVQYGVHELRRDDEAGESEVQAFAWDVQTNTRSVRTFVVPHARMKKVNGKQTREKLIDLGDIYLSNQNIGARAVRECIFTVLPTWYTEEAQSRCRARLEQGDGKPLSKRIEDMVRAFDGIGVAVEQMEQKLGRKRDGWTVDQVAEMTVAYTSITRDAVPADEIFPPRSARVTRAELEQGAAPPPTPEAPETEPPATLPHSAGITAAQTKKLHAVLGQLEVTDRAFKLRLLSGVIDRRVESSGDLTKDEAKVCIDTLESLAESKDPHDALMTIAGDAEGGQ